jgi:hypothetical protein
LVGSHFPFHREQTVGNEIIARDSSKISFGRIDVDFDEGCVREFGARVRERGGRTIGSNVGDVAKASFADVGKQLPTATA